MSRKEILCLDYGHGLPDSGAVGLRTTESELVELVGKRVKYYIENHGVKVVESRPTPNTVPLSDRARVSNNANATHFISLHMNAFSDRLVRGCEVFTSSVGGERNVMAKSILDEIITDHKFPNRGIKHRLFTVLTVTDAPACLVEIEFITNSVVEAYVIKYYDEVAKSIANGYLKHIGVEWVDSDKELTLEEKVEILWNERSSKSEPVKEVVVSKPVEVVKPFSNLSIGMVNDNVRELQFNLNRTGNYNLTVDGSFGNLTRNAVVNFQTSSKITNNGIVDRVTWDRLLDRIKANPWRFMRMFGSNISYAVLPNSEYHIGFEMGSSSGMKTVRSRVNEVLLEGTSPVCAINCGFFGGTVKHIGMILDYGRFRQVPDDRFMDLLYRKSNDMFEINDFGANFQIGNKRDEYHWGIGTSWSLMIDGRINIQKPRGTFTSLQPRTAIGQRENGDVIFVVVDGRGGGSTGVTGNQTAKIMEKLGCVNAVNLDGGGSSTAVEMINGNPRVVNRVSDGSERRVGSVLIAYRK